MSISQNFPSVAPTLNLNFARTKVLDSRITFSRGSTATYVDSDGIIKSAAANVARFDHDPVTGESLGLLVEESRTNLFQYSNRFEMSGGYWNWGNINPYKVMNYDVAPDGTLTAYLVNFGQIPPVPSNWSNGNLRYNTSSPGVTITSGTNYIISLYVKRAKTGSANSIRITINDGTTWTGATSQKYTLTDSWQRITFSVVANATGILNIHVGALTNIPDTDSDCVGNVLLWGGQLEAGTFATTYVPSVDTFTSRASTATYYNSAGTLVTAAINIARSDAYFPDSNGVMRSAGLLLEAAGTNEVTQSQTFSTWTLTNCSITTNATTSPDGTSNASKLIEDSTANVHRIQLSINPTGTYTLSVFAKAAERSILTLMPATTAGGDTPVYFDLSAGTISASLGSANSASIQKFPNGWYRCSVTDVMGGFGYPFIGVAAVSGTQSYTGNGTSGIFIWGAQLEASPYPTSYIPTTSATVTRAADVSSSATVTRSADVATITGTNFSSWYNINEGSTFVSFNSYQNSTRTTIIGPIGSLYTNQSRYIGIEGGSFQIMNDSVGNGVSISMGGANRGKGVVSYSNISNQISAAFNASSVSSTSINSLVWLTGVSGWNLFIRNDGSGSRYNGTISSLIYYPKQLTNTQLQNLTK